VPRLARLRVDDEAHRHPAGRADRRPVVLGHYSSSSFSATELMQ
jgi:hypothetical protein